MKRKLLSVFLSLAMVLTMMPVFAMADETSGGGASGEEASSTEGVAKIGDVTYQTLNAAVEAANDGDTVTITKDLKVKGHRIKIQWIFLKYSYKGLKGNSQRIKILSEIIEIFYIRREKLWKITRLFLLLVRL